jgi:hypothetical protein
MTMATSLERELVELVDAVAPPLLDLDELDRLVAIDEDPDAFDGECTRHDACLPIFAKRLT